MNIKALILIAVSIVAGLFAKAQKFDDYSDTTGTNVLLRKEMAGGVMLHNQGLGFNFRMGKNVTFFKSRIFEVELVSMKHPKQIKVINPYYFNARSYVYGKLNHVYVLRGGFGIKKLLNRKPYWGGIELRYMLQGGVSVAFAKPVYLYFWDATYTFIREERYDPGNEYHGSEYIYGRAPFSRGLGEISVYPGIFVKGGLNFEFGKNNARMKALEAGMVLEFFPLAIPIMAQNPPNNFFPTFYIAFQIGKRYN